MASTVWRGHLAFGLVSFPVRLFRAARAEKVSLRRLYRPAPEPESEPAPAASTPAPAPKLPSLRTQVEAPGPIPAPPLTPTSARQEAPAAPVYRTHNTITTGHEDEPVTGSQLVKGYEYEKGQYVVLEDDELKSLKPETSKEMQIVEFVRLAEIDPIFLETSYYLAPDEPGKRPYALLYEALRKTGYVGVAQLAMHNREHVIIVRPGPSGMIAHTMFYPDEVRKDQEYRADTSALVPRELDLAERLVETLVVPFEPEKFRDSYRERLEQMIAAKVEGHRVSEEPAALKKSAPVIDIVKALQESLNLAKKPPARSAGAQSASEAAPSPAPRRRRSAR